MLNLNEIKHYHFPYESEVNLSMKKAPFLAKNRAHRVSITGGASCPDGIIQQVISRINSFSQKICCDPLRIYWLTFRPSVDSYFLVESL